MSNDVVISVDKLSKGYLVGHEGPKERYHSLRDTLVRHGRNFARKTLDMARGRQIVQGDEVEEFWALKDVSFEVKRGEVLGIIGRNGAGKSTLLKILSRITEPSSGRVVLDGRVASLLEVGTGFHPELTGRENIYLNGAILGMSKAEIRRKFDEIVEFSGVEKFLDTPVKRYSSGMYVRLAFAVAAHLEPEILVVDEVLAVGDAEFQKKCMGKMQDVAKGGRTVLFVSHNLAAVRALCPQSLLLKKGRNISQGPTREVLNDYLTDNSNTTKAKWSRATDSDQCRIAEINIHPQSPVTRGSQLEISVTIGGDLIPGLVTAIHLRDENEALVLNTSDEFGDIKKSQATRTYKIDTSLLNVGRYWVDVHLVLRNIRYVDSVEGEITLELVDNEFLVNGTGAAEWAGVLSPRLGSWT